MSMTERRYLYSKGAERTNELDYLKTNIHKIRDLPLADTAMITNATDGRLDLISLQYFGTYHLGWLICEYNDILDPFAEVITGKNIRIPYIDEYYRFFNRNARTK